MNKKLLSSKPIFLLFAISFLNFSFLSPFAHSHEVHDKLDKAIHLLHSHIIHDHPDGNSHHNENALENLDDDPNYIFKYYTPTLNNINYATSNIILTYFRLPTFIPSEHSSTLIIHRNTADLPVINHWEKYVHSSGNTSPPPQFHA